MPKRDELTNDEKVAVHAAARADERREMKEAQEEGVVLNPAVDESVKAPVPHPEQDPVEVSPEKGLVPDSQIPVFTAGVYAPVSSQPLPNAQRDAEIIIQERHADESDDADIQEAQSVRFDSEASGPRDARDLAILLRRYPHWINFLDQLETLEKNEGVKKPTPWVANPVDLLADAAKFNFLFVGNNGNFLPNQTR